MVISTRGIAAEGAMLLAALHVEVCRHDGDDQDEEHKKQEVVHGVGPSLGVRSLAAGSLGTGGRNWREEYGEKERLVRGRSQAVCILPICIPYRCLRVRMSCRTASSGCHRDHIRREPQRKMMSEYSSVHARLATPQATAISANTT